MEPETETKEPKKILLVEDDQTIRELYATALINEGLDVIMAADGAEGVRIALEKKPSVILFDIEMPVMDGHQAAEKIRLDSWGKKVPIIFLTNLSDAANVAHAHMLQPDDYIVKANVPVKEVINKVRMAMHKA
jgi:DNA-binding response OmpR family regulator